MVGEASDGVRAVRQARVLKPNVVLMDIRMPVMGGLEATKIILDGNREPLPRILIVTTFDEDEHVFAALRSGASGFVLKDTCRWPGSKPTSADFSTSSPAVTARSSS